MQLDDGNRIIIPQAHPSPNQEPTNSERKLVCGDWHPSENTEHPTHFLLPFLSPPVQVARWALMRHFLSVCLSVVETQIRQMLIT